MQGKGYVVMATLQQWKRVINAVQWLYSTFAVWQETQHCACIFKVWHTGLEYKVSTYANTIKTTTAALSYNNDGLY
jgi:hypothetical protein